MYIAIAHTYCQDSSIRSVDDILALKYVVVSSSIYSLIILQTITKSEYHIFTFADFLLFTDSFIMLFFFVSLDLARTEKMREVKLNDKNPFRWNYLVHCVRQKPKFITIGSPI